MSDQNEERGQTAVDAQTVADALRVLLQHGIDDGEGGLDAAIDLLTGERDDEEPLLDEVVSYEDAGLMTRDHGLVLRFRDGGEFQVTVVRSR